MTKGLGANTYNKHNYVDMVTKCKLLDNGQHSMLLKLFQKYKALFLGVLRRVQGAPAKLKLEKDAFLFCARAYTIFKAFEKIAKTK